MKKLYKDDDSFDMFIVAMYEWLLVPVIHHDVETKVHHDEDLLEILTKFRETSVRLSEEDIKRTNEMKKQLHADNNEYMCSDCKGYIRKNEYSETELEKNEERTCNSCIINKDETQ